MARLDMDGMSLEIPSKWATKEVNKAAKCMPGSHWSLASLGVGDDFSTEMGFGH